MSGSGIFGQVIDVEVLQTPGVFSLPGDGICGIFIPVQTSDNFGGVICFNNKKIDIDVGGTGGTCIFSTNSSGETLKSTIKALPNGEILLNGDSKRLVTFQELQNALNIVFSTISSHVHPSNGVVSPSLVGLSCDISLSKTETIKTGG